MNKKCENKERTVRETMNPDAMRPLPTVVTIILAPVVAGFLSVVARELIEHRFGQQGGGTLNWFSKLGFPWVIAPLSIVCCLTFAFVLRSKRGGQAISVLGGAALAVAAVAIFARHLFSIDQERAANPSGGPNNNSGDPTFDEVTDGSVVPVTETPLINNLLADQEWTTDP